MTPFGPPPKVVWLRIGNCHRNRVVDLLKSSQDNILSMDADPLVSLIAIA